MVLGVLGFNVAGTLSMELAPSLEEETGAGVVSEWDMHAADSCVWILGPQLAVLFWEVMELLQMGHWWRKWVTY